MHKLEYDTERERERKGGGGGGGRGGGGSEQAYLEALLFSYWTYACVHLHALNYTKEILVQS